MPSCTPMLFSDESRAIREERDGKAALLKTKSLRSSTFVLVRIFPAYFLLTSKVFELRACFGDRSARLQHLARACNI